MTDFLDDERRRLAYADRAPTREQQADSRGYHSHDPSRHCRDRNCDYEVGGRWSCEYPPICTPQLADGTGRHSRKEMEQDATIAAWDYALGTGPFAPSEGKPDAMAATLCIHTVHGWRCVPGCRAHLTSPIETQTIAGVQFSSVPALCAAFEQLLSASAAYLWTWRPDREHCSGPQMEAYRELRRLVSGAGKDVP